MNSPDWFRHFIDYPRETRLIEVDDCPIHYQLWGDRQRHQPGLVFVHGNGAHAHWWDFIAPAFADKFKVAALDLSGAGDSGHRHHYSAMLFSREIMAVAKDTSMTHAVLVGHSFGGAMARITTWLHQDQLAGLVVVDSALSGHRRRRTSPRITSGKVRLYSTREEAMLRFRLRPPQPCKNTYLIDYIAGHSVRETEGGWCYKSDQAMLSKMFSTMPQASTSTPSSMPSTNGKEEDFPDPVTMVQSIQKPVALIYGEQSRFFYKESLEMARSVIQPGLLCQISDAHHHLFLDQPLGFIDTLRSVLDQILEGTNK